MIVTMMIAAVGIVVTFRNISWTFPETYPWDGYVSNRRWVFPTSPVRARISSTVSKFQAIFRRVWLQVCYMVIPLSVSKVRELPETLNLVQLPSCSMLTWEGPSHWAKQTDKRALGWNKAERTWESNTQYFWSKYSMKEFLAALKNTSTTSIRTRAYSAALSTCRVTVSAVRCVFFGM